MGIFKDLALFFFLFNIASEEDDFYLNFFFFSFDVDGRRRKMLAEVSCVLFSF